ncbi:uncharacterized protein LOC144703082 [Wolffia australiana]
MGGDEVNSGCSALSRVKSLSDLVLGFFENGEGDTEGDQDMESSDEELSGNSAKEHKAFWESQNMKIQVLLSKNSALEKRVLRETEAEVRRLQAEAGPCACFRSSSGACRDCLLRGVADRLRDAGYDSAVCHSKWRTSPTVPKGEHAYVEAVEAPARVVIEVCFRAEFEMARGSEEYRRLVARLPEVFVGKPERLRGVIKAVCAAAKRCMEENKMHMPPWRKSKYMQAKWLSPCERQPPRVALFSPTAVCAAAQRPKPRSSMLTSDLLDNLPGFRRPAVQVL